ncbi:MAG: T9SS type A sorting domain-containing protein [Bacteroidales bacterium]|nr:T9SS type A sorting domain-containing protein [Bacteroidales bacterium]MDY0197795.1 T9SS type A sorting domain-containing protein [Tenuifilaceae bacterium]
MKPINGFLKKTIFVALSIFILSNVYSQDVDWSKQITATTDLQELRISCIDGSGNLIVGGWFNGDLSFVGTIETLSSTNVVAFIAKYDENGSLLWANQVGASSPTTVKVIKTDNYNNIYIVGEIAGSSEFTSQDLNNKTITNTTGFDGFLAKYDPNGNLTYAINIAYGNGIDRLNGVAIDDSENVYITGFFRSSTIVLGNNEGTLNYVGSDNWGNAFVAKFEPNITDDGVDFVSSIQFGTNSDGVSRGAGLEWRNNSIFLALDFKKSILIEGTSPQVDIISTTSWQSNAIVKLSDNFEFQWAKIALDKYSDVGTSNNIVVDEDGNSYLGGRFSKEIFITNQSGETAEAYLSSKTKGYFDCYISGFSSSGDPLWLKTFGGLGEERLWGLSYSSQVISAAGFFNGNLFAGNEPLSASDTLKSNGGRDGFVVNLDVNGNLLSSRALGAIANEEIFFSQLVSDANGIDGGIFKSPILNIGGVDFTKLGLANDAFLAKHINIHILPTISETTCSGSQDGTLSIEVFGGGQAPYNYVLNKVDGNIIGSGTYTGVLNFTDLESGVYRFMISDNLNRSVTKFYHIIAPAPIDINGTVTDVAGCYANENGQIGLTVTGGVGEYIFFWDTPNGYGLVPNAQNQSSLTAGSYTVTVTDANGCMASENFEISQLDKINFEGSIVINNTNTDPLNPNGSIDLIVNNGVEPYSFTWKGPNGFTSSVQNLIGIRGGTYILSLEDANGCIANASFNLGDENLFNAWITQTINPKCKGGNDGNATVDFENVTGGVTIVWSNGQTDVLTATNLSAGEYSVTLTDDMGTPSDTGDDIEITLMPVLVGEPDFALNVTSIVKKTTCPADNDGSIQLSVNGWSQPYQYDWSTSDGNGLTDGVKDQFELTIGSYSYTVTDKYGCAVGSAVNVSSNYSAPSFSFNVSPSNIICEGTEVVFSASEGFLYQFFINDVPQGDFSTTNTLTIIEPIDGMRVRAMGMNTAGCTGESEEIVLTVTSNVGVPTFTSGATTLCFGATEIYVATADNAESIVYSIESGTAVVDPSTGEVTNINADFTIRATAYGYNGCGEEFTDLDITVNPIPEPTISTIDNLAICSGDDISVEFTSNIQNADTYQWIKNTEVITGANESSYTATEIGIYSLEVTENGCSGISNSLEIIQIELPVPTISTVDPLEWTEGESVSVNFTVDILDADAYQWLLNSNPITDANANNYLASQEGIYSVGVTLLGCMGVSNTLEIAVVPTETYVVTFTVTNNSANAIEGAEVSVSGYDPIVTDASGEATISLPNGTYTFEVSANDYHLYSDGFEVNNADVPVAVQLIGVGINPNQLLTVSTYPNPFKNYIYITNVELVKRVIVSNIAGQVVLDTTPDGTNKVNAQGIKSGIYIVRLMGYDGKTAIYKMIKEQ